MALSQIMVGAEPKTASSKSGLSSRLDFEQSESKSKLGVNLSNQNKSKVRALAIEFSNMSKATKNNQSATPRSSQRQLMKEYKQNVDLEKSTFGARDYIKQE